MNTQLRNAQNLNIMNNYVSARATHEFHKNQMNSLDMFGDMLVENGETNIHYRLPNGAVRDIDKVNTKYGILAGMGGLQRTQHKLIDYSLEEAHDHEDWLREADASEDQIDNINGRIEDELTDRERQTGEYAYYQSDRNGYYTNGSLMREFHNEVMENLKVMDNEKQKVFDYLNLKVSAPFADGAVYNPSNLIGQPSANPQVKK